MLPGTALLVLLCSSAAWSQPVHLQIDVISPAVIQGRLGMVPGSVPERRSALESLFRKVGCDGESLSEAAVRHLKDPNIVCVLPGGPDIIVAGGHYDFAAHGTGAVDDWSGAALLPSLYESLRGQPRKHTLVFIAFSGEEAGLVGSNDYVKHLTREHKKSIHAMVNLECLGTTPPKVWASRADKRLLELYARLVLSTGAKPEASNLDGAGDDDSHPFLDAGIPVITIHSITRDTLHVLHSPADNLKAIHPDDYYAAYRLTAQYLELLDQLLD